MKNTIIEDLKTIPQEQTRPISSVPQEASASEARYAYDHEVLSWEAPEFVKHDRGKGWFIGAGIAVLMILLYSILSGSWSTGLVFIALTVVFYQYHHQEPKTIRVIISEIGIKVDNREYPFSTIKYFWIVYNPPSVKTLHLATTNRMFKEVVIQLNGQDPGDVRNYLVQQLPEVVGQDESFTHLLTRLLRLT